jgi:hypothetical protein
MVSIFKYAYLNMSIDAWFRKPRSAYPFLSLSLSLSLSPPQKSSLTIGSPLPTDILLFWPPHSLKLVPKPSPIYHLQAYTCYLDQIKVYEEKSQPKTPQSCRKTPNFPRLSVPISAKLADTTYWALKPSSPWTHSHQSHPHWTPEEGE